MMPDDVMADQHNPLVSGKTSSLVLGGGKVSARWRKGGRKVAAMAFRGPRKRVATDVADVTQELGDSDHRRALASIHEAFSSDESDSEGTLSDMDAASP